MVIGVSADSLAKHQRFAANHRLPGRVTYVIDPQGIVRHIFSAQLAADQNVQEACRC